jgi:hypothetical protein
MTTALTPLVIALGGVVLAALTFSGVIIVWVAAVVLGTTFG